MTNQSSYSDAAPPARVSGDNGRLMASSEPIMLAPSAADSLQPDVALCVDLDGTLVKSDTLHDSLLLMARQHPRALLQVPGWIAQGKAAFKRHVTSSVELDVEHLPYNRPLLEWLRKQAGNGREIYLATAADLSLAQRVASHLGFFAGVLATDGTTNLAGTNKLHAFRKHFGEQFCYIGNATPDTELLAACVSPMVANPTPGLRGKLQNAGTVPIATFSDRSSALKSWLRAIRLHQWAKNTLIFVPLLLAHAWNAATVAGALVAFLSFGLCASATYIVNDLLDIDADRKHPRKRQRPFAAGDLSAQAGVAMVLVLGSISAVLAVALPGIMNAVPGSYALAQPFRFFIWLVIYTITTLTYTFYLKRKLLLDVFILSGLYTVRILAGSAATSVPISAWLAGFSIFLFLSLAFVKRFSELESLRERGGIATSGRGYFVADLEQLRALGTGAAYAAVVVLTLYINDPHTFALYRHTTRLWLMIPVMLLWLSQIWMLTSRGEMHDDPVVWAISDKRSLLLGMLMALVFWWAL